MNTKREQKERKTLDCETVFEWITKVVVSALCHSQPGAALQ